MLLRWLIDAETAGVCFGTECCGMNFLNRKMRSFLYTFEQPSSVKDSLIFWPLAMILRFSLDMLCRHLRLEKRQNRQDPGLRCNTTMHAGCWRRHMIVFRPALPGPSPNEGIQSSLSREDRRPCIYMERKMIPNLASKPPKVDLPSRECSD